MWAGQGMARPTISLNGWLGRFPATPREWREGKVAGARRPNPQEKEPRAPCKFATCRVNSGKCREGSADAGVKAAEIQRFG
jgi:hypothetical protein